MPVAQRLGIDGCEFPVILTPSARKLPRRAWREDSFCENEAIMGHVGGCLPLGTYSLRPMIQLQSSPRYDGSRRLPLHWRRAPTDTPFPWRADLID